VFRLARPGDKDAVFSIAETAIGDHAEHTAVLVWPLSSPELLVEGLVREISPIADPTTRTYTVKVTLKDPPPQVRFGMSIGGRLQGRALPVVALPLSALFEKNGAPAVWVFDQASGTVVLKPVTVARYEADTVIIADGVATGAVVVTAGINMLRENQKVRLAMPASMATNQ
jgi:RND family efflux transporter MFP subunit